MGGLIADAVGNFFGTTQGGGGTGAGTVFEIGKINGGYASTPTTLVSFDGSNGRSLRPVSSPTLSETCSAPQHRGDE